MKKYTAEDIKGVSLNFFCDGVCILDFVFDVDDYAITADVFNGVILSCIRKNKIYTTMSGRNYFKKHRRRYYLDEFMRIGEDRRG